MEPEIRELPCPSPQKAIRVGDARAKSTKITKQTPRNPQAERAFLLGKLRLLRTQPEIEPRERSRLLEELESKFMRLLGTGSFPPVPGGVGTGMFYNDACKNNYVTGTGVYWEIICPQPPGGNINTYFYLTATNRAARGVEAFISYDGQSQTYFKVFDWVHFFAGVDPWKRILPFAELGAYLTTRTAHGNNYQVLPVLNLTVQDVVGAWYNQVWLLDAAAGRWDFIYQHNYAATLADQQIPFYGSWGPIVETFQPAYVGTKPMGALSTQLLGRDAQGQWGAWKPLLATESDVRKDHMEFSFQFHDPNDSWAVLS